MLSVAKLVRRIRQRLHDMDEITYDDEEIVDCINYGLRFVQRTIAKFRPALLMSEVKGTLATGEKAITLDNRPMKIINVTVGDDEKPLHETDIAFAIHEKEVKAEQPKGFYLTGTQTINFFPTPTSPTKYKVRMVRDMATDSGNELTLDSKSPLLTEFDDFLIEYAVIRLSVGEEYDMTQEAQIMANIAQQIQAVLAPPPTGIQMRGYWQ